MKYLTSKICNTMIDESCTIQVSVNQVYKSYFEQAKKISRITNLRQNSIVKLLMIRNNIDLCSHSIQHKLGNARKILRDNYTEKLNMLFPHGVTTKSCFHASDMFCT